MRAGDGRQQYDQGMDLTSKLLRDVEFRDRLRGYDTDEVDEFLERVAVGIDELYAELRAAKAQQVAPPVSEPPRSPIEDDDSIRRTLVLAQRTADLAIAEAKSEAENLLQDARAESERLLADAKAAALRLENEAEIDLAQRVARLTDQRDILEHDVRMFASLVESERGRLSETLSLLMSQVSELGVSDALGAVATVPQAPEVSPPPFLADDPTAPEAYEEESPDLDLELDLSIAPQTERPVTAPTPTSETEEPEVDDALWERWANSGDTDDKRIDDPFQFGRTED